MRYLHEFWNSMLLEILQKLTLFKYNTTQRSFYLTNCHFWQEMKLISLTQFMVLNFWTPIRSSIYSWRSCTESQYSASRTQLSIYRYHFYYIVWIFSVNENAEKFFIRSKLSLVFLFRFFLIKKLLIRKAEITIQNIFSKWSLKILEILEIGVNSRIIHI